MTPDRAVLLERIESFDIDRGEAALPFAARLARGNGWPRPYAERVVREYKRYVFLCMTSEEPVCPSEDVDAAWHLHLTYTRSYWKRFCGGVLGRPLHHDPTRGGPAEAAKHLAMYRGTLAAYLEAFGEEPPADVWPAPEVRFGEDLRHRVVNTARHWVIPKRPVRRVVGVTAAGVLFAALVPGCAGGELNPFNLAGTDFLWFLIPVMVAAVVAGRVVRSAMRKPDPQPGDDGLNLSWEEAAFLAGGYPRLTTAAISRLVAGGVVKVADGVRLQRVEGVTDRGFGEVERAVCGQLPFGNTPTELRAVQRVVEARFGAEAKRLEDEGFLLSGARKVQAVLAGVVPLLLVLGLLALPRLLMGLADGKPVGYLVTTVIVGGFIGLVVSAAGPLRVSRRGEAVLRQLRSRHAALKSGGSWGGAPDAALAVALFGTAALAGSTYAYLQSWYPRQTNPGADGGCSSGCGTGSGCSGGGDGGGGCGGCGGGGD